MSRPENENPPEIYYNETTASKYHTNSRIQLIQRRMAERALELLNIPVTGTLNGPRIITKSSFSGVSAAAAAFYNNVYRPLHILDVGCGTCISSDVLASLHGTLTEGREEGDLSDKPGIVSNMTFTGVDISRDMLKIAKQREIDGVDVYGEEEERGGGISEDDCNYMNENEKEHGMDIEEDGGVDGQWTHDDNNNNTYEGDLIVEDHESRYWREVMQVDIGQGLPFRPGTFDGCISISAIQWLCHMGSKRENMPQRKLRLFFKSLYNCLKRGAKAVLQFYPENVAQINMISEAAMRCGFRGGVVVDFPHSTRAKKYYLVLSAGVVSAPGEGGGSLAGGFVLPRNLEDGAEAEGEFDEESENEFDKNNDHNNRERNQERGSNFERGADIRQALVRGRDRAMVGSRQGRNRHVMAAKDRQKRRKRDNRPVVGTKEWVLLKKEQRRKFGLETKPDSKYTQRKRKPRF